MKNLPAVLLIAGLSLSVGMGCSKSSPTGPSNNNKNTTLDSTAGTLSTHSGANAAVPDSATAATVGTSVQNDAFGAMDSAIKLGVVAKRLALVAATTGYSINGTFNGTVSGSATVTGSWGVGSTGTQYTMTVTFSNFSDDGVLYLAGQMSFLFTVNTAGTLDTYTINGSIRFNGSYVGTNDFSYDITINSGATPETETWSYTSTISSNGKTITVSETETI